MEILKLLSVEGHPHVVRLFEFIETPTKFFMVMTNCPGGDFFDFLGVWRLRLRLRLRLRSYEIYEVYPYTHTPHFFFDFIAYRGSVTEEEARVLFLQVNFSYFFFPFF